MFNCPVCQSENTQSLRMICESGTATTTGGGIGVGSGGGVGIAIGGSKIQSTLAAAHNPGSKPVKKEAGGCAAIFIVICGGLGIGGLASGNPTGAIFLLIAIGLLMYVINANSGMKEKHKADLVEWEAKSERLNKGWLCHRCGHSWVPE